MLYSQWIHGTEDLSKVKDVRTKVFIEEQGYTPEQEFDAYDAMAWHIAIMLDEACIATGRVYLQDGQYRIGRIAVLKEYRGNGLGDAVVKLLLDRAMQASAPKIYVSSQLYTEPFYQRYGFQRIAEPAIPEGDIKEHVEMCVNFEDVLFPSKCGGGCSGCSGCGGGCGE